MKTVKELKQLVPMADVMEISDDKRYLVRLNAQHIPCAEMENIAANLERFGIRAIVIDQSLNIYELGPKE